MDDSSVFLFFFLHACMHACMFPEINIKFMKADNMLICLRLTLSMPYILQLLVPARSRNDNIGGLPWVSQARYWGHLVVYT